MTPTGISPLNGEKTHPLSEAALSVLHSLASGAMPAQEINPGVQNRFMREALAEYIDLPSPYRTHKGRKIKFMQITDAGRARLQQ